MTDDQLVEYFNEHILYELLMLRYTHLNLQSAGQLLWNAMFAAFNVSARNLYNFLKNRERSNVRVVDYKDHYGKWKCGKPTKITGSLDMLHKQCLHLDRNRPKLSPDKINLERIQIVFDWVQSNILTLVGHFDDGFQRRVALERADIPADQTLKIVTGPTGPSAPAAVSATNHISIV